MVSEEPQPFFAFDPTELNVHFGAPQAQSRVTLAFRGLLVLPHVVVLTFSRFWRSFSPSWDGSQR